MNTKQVYFFFCTAFLALILYMPYNFRRSLMPLSNDRNQLTIILAIAGILLSVMSMMWHKAQRKPKNTATPVSPGISVLFQLLWAVLLVVSIVMVLIGTGSLLFGDAPGQNFYAGRCHVVCKTPVTLPGQPQAQCFADHIGCIFCIHFQ